MSKDNLDKVAAASAKAEAHTDAILTKLVNFPYSWIPAVIVVGLAVVGAMTVARFVMG